MFQEDGNSAYVGFRYSQHTHQLRFELENLATASPLHLQLRLEYQSLLAILGLRDPQASINRSHHLPNTGLSFSLFLLLNKHRRPLFPSTFGTGSFVMLCGIFTVGLSPPGCCKPHTCCWPHTHKWPLHSSTATCLLPPVCLECLSHLPLNVQIIFFQTQHKFSFSNLMIPFSSKM